MAELRDRDAAEQAVAARLSRLSAKHRRELDGLMGDPPSVQNVPPEFWERVQREQEEELAAVLYLLWLMSAEQHGWSGDQASVPAAMAAAGRARTTAASYVETSIQHLSATPTDTLAVFGPGRAANLAVTETTWAATAGAEAAIGVTVGVSLQDRWRTERDARVCPICSPLEKVVRDDWAYRYPSGPPAHPNCRCWIEYAGEQ